MSDQPKRVWCRHVMECEKQLAIDTIARIEQELAALRDRLMEAENLIHSIAEWTDNEKLETQCLKFLDGEDMTNPPGKREE